MLRHPTKISILHWRPGITDYSAIFLLAQKLKKLIGLIVLLAAAYTTDYAKSA
jgi:uncharacterized membrane protein